jgi:hypothetical protein
MKLSKSSRTLRIKRERERERERERGREGDEVLNV